MLLDGGDTYLGGIDELISFAEKAVTPPFDRTEDDKTDWVSIAKQECEVGSVALCSTLAEPKHVQQHFR